MKRAASLFTLTLLAATWPALPAVAQDKTVYRCPGPPVLYTDALSPQEARERGCRALEGTPVTVIAPLRPRTAAPAPGTAAPGAAPAAAPNAPARPDSAEQRARDSDARRILTEELQREEERLVVMRREFNNGEPERRGDERNAQKYIDRVAEMRAAILRKEADIAAIRRELAKLPAS